MCYLLSVSSGNTERYGQDFKIEDRELQLTPEDGADKNIGKEMLNWLRGPRPLNGQDISFLNDRFRDGKSYIPFSYFVGASPENGYTPRQPFTLLVGSNHTSNVEEGYCKLFIPCGGADDPRPIKLRRKGNGQWFLWEQYLMTGIRIPTSADPWA